NSSALSGTTSQHATISASSDRASSATAWALAMPPVPTIPNLTFEGIQALLWGRRDGGRPLLCLRCVWRREQLLDLLLPRVVFGVVGGLAFAGNAQLRLGDAQQLLDDGRLPLGAGWAGGRRHQRLLDEEAGHVDLDRVERLVLRPVDELLAPLGG